MAATLERPVAKPRMLALDVLRGQTMAFMVLVSNPGSLDIYTQLDHAPWNGWTATDVIFPTFLWILGVSVTLSIGSRRAKGATRREIALQALKRSVLLYLIGVGIYAIGNFHWHTLRALGVLQRIAICALVATLLCLWTRTRTQVMVVLALLAGYWALLRFVPVPGYGAGNLSMEGNLAHYVDRVVLGSHNYSGTGTWDPEGLLSTLPAIATSLLGVLAGTWMQRVAGMARVKRMLLVGAVLIVAGCLLSVWVPINKKLWSDSFCVLMAGIDFTLLGGLLWVIDERQWRWGLTLPQAFGRNALAIYILSEVSSAVLWNYPTGSNWPFGGNWHDRIFHAVFAGLGPAKFSSLLYAMTVVATLSAMAWLMQRRGWTLKL